MKRTKDYLIMLGMACTVVLFAAVAQDQAPVVAPVQGGGAAGAAGAGVQGVQPQQVAPAPAPAVRAPTRPTGMRNAPAAAGGVGGVTPPTRRAPLSVPATRGVAAGTVDDATDSDIDSDGDDGAGGGSKTTTTALKFDNAPADIIVAAYCEQTGKTALWNPEAPKANITLKSQPGVELSKEEYIEAIEVVLGMNGISLEEFGDKFIKVLPRKTIRTDGTLPVLMGEEASVHPEKGRMISQMIQLKSITAAEAQKALEGFKKPDGLFQIFERTNSILVTDTQENVNRMVEIVKFIDQPLPVTEEVFHRPISFAKAEEIKKRIEEVVAESQKQTQAKEEVKLSPTGAPGMVRTSGAATTQAGVRRPLPPGLSRLGQQATQPESVTANEVLSALISDADRGMIRGKVQIISDERTNQLIIITRPENMVFFDRIISVLDIETAPDFKVEVRRLEFADAEEVSTMLNDLIGNVSGGKKDDSAPTTAARGAAAGEAGGRSTTLAEAAAARANRTTPTAGAADAGASKLGQLSKDNIKILADKRTNAIVMMGSPNDLAAIEEIIKNMDIQLSQVLIETVVLEVGLNDKIETGIDWVRRMKPTTTIGSVLSGFDSDGNPIYSQQEVERGSSYRYTMGGGGGSRVAQDLWSIGTNLVSLGSSGIEYMATIKSLRLDAVISASKSDDNTKVLSSPVLLTVDNKEATIEATELKYMYKGMRYMGYSSSIGGAGSYEPDIEQRDVGLTVKVTPRINPSGNVMLTIEETFENVVEPGQKIQDQYWPTITTRKLSADVSVGNGDTVILGGLVKTTKGQSASGIPILKDIPFIGKYLFGSTSKVEARSEMLVFLTPYVIDNAEDMDREARRRKDYINAPDIWTKGWSDSKLADPVSEKEMKQRLEQKRAIENAWRKYREGLEAQQEVEESVIDERSRTEALSREQTSANFAREAEGYKAKEKEPAEAAPIGTLRVSESTEVLRPPSMSESEFEALLAEPHPGAVQGGGVRIDAEKPKRSWWKFW